MTKVMLLRTYPAGYLVAPAVPHPDFGWIWVEGTGYAVPDLDGLEVMNG